MSTCHWIKFLYTLIFFKKIFLSLKINFSIRIVTLIVIPRNEKFLEANNISYNLQIQQ